MRTKWIKQKKGTDNLKKQMVLFKLLMTLVSIKKKVLLLIGEEKNNDQRDAINF